MIISMIAAMSENHVIGLENKLPWNIPEDMKRVLRLTAGHALIMGRKTFESLPNILPGRLHVVITRSVNYKQSNSTAFSSDLVIPVSSPAAALTVVEKERIRYPELPEEVFIFGGAEIYRQFLAQSDRLYITLIKQHITGDAFFPNISPTDWKEVYRECMDGFDFLEYRRIF